MDHLALAVRDLERSARVIFCTVELCQIAEDSVEIARDLKPQLRITAVGFFEGECFLKTLHGQIPLQLFAGLPAGPTTETPTTKLPMSKDVGAKRAVMIGLQACRAKRSREGSVRSGLSRSTAKRGALAAHSGHAS